MSSKKNAAVSESLIPLSIPEISGNEWKYVKECLDTGWVSSAGPFVSRFEEKIAAYVGSTQAVAVANGTVALHTALIAVGVKPGEEVIVPDLTFIASANAVSYCRAHPVFMDVDPNTWHMDVRKLTTFLQTECEMRGEACFNKRTDRRVRAIVPVHILGLACEINAIVGLAKKYHLRVVEDAAEAMGVCHTGRHVGTFGDVGVLSFNGSKLITAGGGGALITNDKTLAEYARYLTTQAKDDSVEYVHGEIGYNYRLTNIQAAIGIAQLERIHEFIQKKRAIAQVYEEALSGVSGISLMPVPPGVEPTYWLYTVLLPEQMTLSERKRIIRELNSRGIGARPLWHVLHQLPPYKSNQAFQIEWSIRLYQRGISLPSSVGLPDCDLDRCVAEFKRIVAG